MVLCAKNCGLGPPKRAGVFKDWGGGPPVYKTLKKFIVLMFLFFPKRVEQILDDMLVELGGVQSALLVELGSLVVIEVHRDVDSVAEEAAPQFAVAVRPLKLWEGASHI